NSVIATDTAADGSQYIQSFDIDIDTVAPTLSTAFSGTHGNNGFYSSAVTATLTAGDGTSGLAIFFYSLDSGPMTTYTAPFTITGDGAHTLTTIVIDYASNSVIENDTINIDATPPTLSGSFGGAQGINGWSTSNGLET